MARMALLSAFLCLAFLGCQSTGTKPSGGKGKDDTKTSIEKDAPFWKRNPGKTSVPPLEDSGEPSRDAILSGRVIDANGKAMPNAQITWVRIGDDGPIGKPKGLQADSDGVFMIEGLIRNATHQLSVRSDTDGKVLAAIVQTVTPNGNLRVVVREGNAGTLTPDPAPPLGSGNPFTPKGSTAPPLDRLPDSSPSDPDSGFAPGKTPPASRGYIPPPPPAAPNRQPPPNPNIADAADLRSTPPTANIPPPPPASMGPPSRMIPPPPPTVGDGDPQIQAEPFAPTEEPLPGRPRADRGPGWSLKLEEYSSGKAWDFSDRNGKLVLLDFWRTNCIPCLNAMPDLIDLQKKHGKGYLEVIGVALEGSGPRNQHVTNIDGVLQKMRRKGDNINYGIYLDPEGKAQTLFKVTSVPTLVLLDGSGNILWRGHPKDRDRLESAIESALKQRR